MELLPLFDERKKEISEISAHIKTIQTSLDDIIFFYLLNTIGYIRYDKRNYTI